MLACTNCSNPIRHDPTAGRLPPWCPHCGATLPYLAGRIDSSYVKPYSLGRPLETPPSEQLRGFWTDTIAQSRETLDFARGFFADGHVMFASDYPYFEPGEELAFVRGAVGDDAAILGASAVALFGVDGAAG